MSAAKIIGARVRTDVGMAERLVQVFTDNGVLILDDPKLHRWYRYKRQQWREGRLPACVADVIQEAGLSSLLVSATNQEYSRLMVGAVCRFIKAHGKDPEAGHPYYIFLNRKRAGTYRVYGSDLTECQKGGVPNLLEKPAKKGERS